MPQPRHTLEAANRMERVRLALDGLSVGDALGERFFRVPLELAAQRALPKAPWHYTDDTEMALAITHVLDVFGYIEQDELAAAFAQRYRRDPRRGYGARAHEILMNIRDGADWRQAARAVFDGAGSMGNGSAMRVAPVGAYFADDYEAVVEQARLSAEVTHAHPDGIAGAIAVAVAAAWACRRGKDTADGMSMLETAQLHTPRGETNQGLQRALSLKEDASIESAVQELGNGSRVICADTVPFCLWIAARHLDKYEDATWATISAGGDIDTNCAIVGGIVALAAGPNSIPRDWVRHRESLV